MPYHSTQSFSRGWHCVGLLWRHADLTRRRWEAAARSPAARGPLPPVSIGEAQSPPMHMSTTVMVSQPLRSHRRRQPRAAGAYLVVVVAGAGPRQCRQRSTVGSRLHTPERKFLSLLRRLRASTVAILCGQHGSTASNPPAPPTSKRQRNGEKRARLPRQHGISLTPAGRSESRNSARDISPSGMHALQQPTGGVRRLTSLAEGNGWSGEAGQCRAVPSPRPLNNGYWTHH